MSSFINTTNTDTNTDTPDTATHCINPECLEPLEAGARFCPYCAREQPDAAAVAAAALAARLESIHSAASFPDSEPGASAAPALLVMRASENIWNFEEPEHQVVPGQRRPLVLLDEQTVHLAHTSRHLSPEELLHRVQTLIRAQEVPVEVRLLSARWQSDGREARPRLVASLGQGHAYSDMKMILGVDYLGRWASIHMCLGAEPEPLPPVPRLPPTPPAPVPWGPIILGILGVPLLAAYGLGLLFLVGAIIWYALGADARKNAYSQALQQHAAGWEQERQRRERERVLQKAFRSFKVDDMRLFSSAMQEIFQAVVDDIVKQEGATVERVEGGQGGFLSSGGLTQATPTPRRNDAARAAV